MTKAKSPKNKTIDISIDEGKHYLEKCIDIENIRGIDSVINKTIVGDTFLALDKLPKQSVDLLIVDPPYTKKAMVSQPMGGKTDEEIDEV